MINSNQIPIRITIYCEWLKNYARFSIQFIAWNFVFSRVKKSLSKKFSPEHAKRPKMTIQVQCAPKISDSTFIISSARRLRFTFSLPRLTIEMFTEMLTARRGEKIMQVPTGLWFFQHCIVRKSNYFYDGIADLSLLRIIVGRICLVSEATAFAGATQARPSSSALCGFCSFRWVFRFQGRRNKNIEEKWDADVCGAKYEAGWRFQRAISSERCAELNDNGFMFLNILCSGNFMFAKPVLLLMQKNN